MWGEEAVLTFKGEQMAKMVVLTQERGRGLF